MAPRKMAEESEPRVFFPKTLYELSLSTIVGAAVIDKFLNLKCFSDLPKDVKFDLYYQLYKEKELYLLGVQLSDLETFSKMLRVTSRHVDLAECFQGLIDHGIQIAEELVTKYCLCCASLSENPAARKKTINLGLKLGGFLSDCGWYKESRQVLLECRRKCLENNTTPKDWGLTLECCRRLLHAEAEYCALECATDTQLLALEMVERLKEAESDKWNYAALYVEFSIVHNKKNEYDQAYRWSVEALKQVKPTLPARVIIDVLRQAAKSCVLKHEFQKANLLIRQALYLARQAFDRDHPMYSNVLIDYGYYLLNFDRIGDSITVYKKALHIREPIFGKMNLHIALVHEDLAYALYAYEYSSGKFQQASHHSRKAIDIMEKLLHGDHLLLANARRVQALIFEEIAIETTTEPIMQHLLHKAECLHMSALQLARKAFGEKNVQTAKHYGNLGRLYQSMLKFETAEKMHMRAIQIKEEILGPDDYEVGLSVGHLASLYNYHMRRYRDAEKLYHRSIAIGLKLFGRSYTGLEYDYRGLLHVYTKLDEHGKVAEYEHALNNWQVLRFNIESKDPLIDLEKEPQPLGDVIDTFFSM